MNDNIIIKFIDLIMSWSRSAQIFGFLTLLFSVGFFMFNEFRKAVIQLLQSTANLLFLKASENPIKHPFFLQQALFLLQIDRVDFGDKNKTWLFKTLLKIKFKISFEIIYEFVKSKAWVKQNKYELQASLLLLIKNIIEQYEMKIEQAFIVKFKESGSRLFNIIYLSEKGFKSYHKRNVENIQQNIAKTFMVDSYNNKEIVNSFILQIWVALDTAINDCVAAFKNLNGNLRSELDKINSHVQA